MSETITEIEAAPSEDELANIDTTQVLTKVKAPATSVLRAETLFPCDITNREDPTKAEYFANYVSPAGHKEQTPCTKSVWIAIDAQNLCRKVKCRFLLHRLPADTGPIVRIEPIERHEYDYGLYPDTLRDQKTLDFRVYDGGWVLPVKWNPRVRYDEIVLLKLAMDKLTSIRVGDRIRKYPVISINTGDKLVVLSSTPREDDVK